MGDHTGIPYCDSSWHMLAGCTPISAGCAHCWAATVAHRLSRNPLVANRYQGLTTPEGRWTGAVRLIPEALAVPLRWRRPRRIAVAFGGDIFHPSLPREHLAAVFGVMASVCCEHHTFQVLTKRPELARAWFAENTDHATDCGETAARLTGDSFASYSFGAGGPWPIPNVWLGASVENRAALSRIEHLRACPAALRWLSCEPLLEDLGTLDLRGIGWVVVGCESGPRRRPMDLAWAESVAQQCKAAGTKLFVKQLDINGRVSHDPKEWPEALRVQEYPNA